MSSKSKSKKVMIALTVIFIFLSAVLFFIAFGVTEFAKKVYDESNTTEYSAIFRSMEESKNKKGYLVYLEDYDVSFQIYKDTIASDESMGKLESGASVTFRTWTLLDNLLKRPDADGIPFVTLNIGESEIVSFESYNRMEDRQTAKVKIAGCVFAVAFLAGAAACVIRWVKLNKELAHKV